MLVRILEIGCYLAAAAVLSWASLQWWEGARRKRDATRKMFLDLNDRLEAAQDTANEALDEAGWQKERTDRLMRQLEEQGVAQFPGEWGPPMLFAPPPESMPDPPNVQGAPPTDQPSAHTTTLRAAPIEDGAP